MTHIRTFFYAFALFLLATGGPTFGQLRPQPINRWPNSNNHLRGPQNNNLPTAPLLPARYNQPTNFNGHHAPTLMNGWTRNRPTIGFNNNFRLPNSRPLNRIPIIARTPMTNSSNTTSTSTTSSLTAGANSTADHWPDSISNTTTTLAPQATSSTSLAIPTAPINLARPVDASTMATTNINNWPATATVTEVTTSVASTNISSTTN